MSLSSKIKQLQDLKDNPEFKKAIIQAKKGRSPKKKMPIKGMFFIFFGLPFLVVGIGVLIYGLSCWITYIGSGTWERVPVSILSLELVKHSSTDSDSGPTWEVQADYSYNYNGITYKNDKVDIMGGSSSDYGFHNAHYIILKQAENTDQNYLAYVNPKNPGEAVLFRDMGVFMLILPLFGLVFALAGGGIIIATLSTLTRKYRFKKKLKLTPEAPWLAFNTWKNNRTIHSQLKNALIVLGSALFTALFLSQFVIIIIKMDVPFFVYIIIGVFLLLNFALFIYAGYKLFQYLKWGKTCFKFNKVPFRPGETLKGMIVNPKKIKSFNGFKACLLCSQDEIVTTRSGSSSTTSVERRDLYEKEYLIKEDKQDRYGGTSIWIDIDIPADLPGTAQPVSDEDSVTTYWQLEITAETPGIDFKETFDLPVFSF